MRSTAANLKLIISKEEEKEKIGSHFGSIGQNREVKKIKYFGCVMTSVNSKKGHNQEQAIKNINMVRIPLSMIKKK